MRTRIGLLAQANASKQGVLSLLQAQEICPEPAALVSWLGTEKRPPSGGLFILSAWTV